MEFLKHKKKTTTPASTTSVAKSEPLKESTRRSKVLLHTTQSSPARTPQLSCSVCGGERHPMYQCPTFKAMANDAKQSHVRNNHLCFNCVYSGHRTRDCHSSYRCKHCGKPHHTCLHKEQMLSNSGDSSTSQPQLEQTSPVTPMNTASTSAPDIPTLLTTVQVLLEWPTGQRVQTRALLDTGAAISLVSRRITQQLNLKRHPYSISFSGVQGSAAGDSTHSLSNLPTFLSL